MTLSIVPTDSTGINNLAEGVSGFLDPADEALQETMMTTLFVSGACNESQGRAAYMIMDDGSKLWMPNSLRCWLVDLKIVEQRYQDFDPIDKLLIRVTAVDGSAYIYRTSLNSWLATSFLQHFKYMTRKQLAEQIMITLVPKGRATFVNVQYCEGGSFHRVEIPKHEFGSGKYGYDTMLDCISWANNTAQDNKDSPLIEAQVSTENDAFEIPEGELDELLDEIRSVELPNKRKFSTVSHAVETNV